MSVWLTIPSARPEDAVELRINKWRQLGYRIALWRDKHPLNLSCDAVIVGHYPGYASAVNNLILSIAIRDPEARWFIAAGDDMDPDPYFDAATIAHQNEDHFGGADHGGSWTSTFGVMQPTGDRWGDGGGAYIDRVAGSAWIGREFARRVNQGKGPLWPEYTHMGVDEELQHIAIRLGVFWQRPDLTQYHDHWGRPREGETLGQASRMPGFLASANSPEEWARYKRIFASRAANGFPGSELIA